MTEIAWGPRELNLVDALGLAVVMTDLEGRIVLWSREAEQLYGWDERAALGREIFELLSAPEDQALARVVFERVASGGDSAGERTLQRNSGESIRIRSLARPIRDAIGDVIGVVGLSTDITDVWVAEGHVADASSRLRLALDVGGLGTWRWDIASGTIDWDERLEALWGLEPGTFPGTYEAYVGLVHPEDRDEVLRTVQRAVAEGTQYRVEHRVVWPDGTIRWIGGAGGATFGPDGDVTGTIGCVEDITERVETDRERQELLERLTEAVESERIQRERLELLTAVNDALNSSSTVDQIMVAVASLAVPRLGDWSAIHLLPANGRGAPEVEVSHADPTMVAYARELHDRFPYDPDAPVGVAHVIRSGRTEFYPEISDTVLSELDATEEEREIVGRLALRSSITVPIAKRGRVLGAMQFVMAHSSRRYTPDDVALAEALAGRIAASIDNRRLQEEQRKIAHTLQASLLPASLPAVPGAQIAVRYWAAGEATEVGGDFYDVFAVDGENWAVVIGDVCGTGPAAAALTGLARHTIRTSVWRRDDPIETLRVLNHAILRSDANSFCTVAIGSLSSTQGRVESFEITSGGHPLPIVATRQAARTIGRTGTLVGCLPEIRATTESVKLDPGDTLVFYTDGATDAPGAAGLDDEQFMTLVQESVAGDAEETADNIHLRLEAIRPFHERDDDLALLVIRIDGKDPT